jgi:hypothetical protein
LHKRLSKNYKKNIQIKFSRKNRKIWITDFEETFARNQNKNLKQKN